MLFDTDVIIWYMRGNLLARETLESTENIGISAITYMELVQGMRNKHELAILDKTLASWEAAIYPLNEPISNTATALMKQFFLSHSLELADALIASTAMESKIQLVTANDKHYRMIDELELLIFRPN